jgi:hypothetical protein
MMKKCVILFLMLWCVVAQAKLVNRYSFTDGDTAAVDSVGGQDGTLTNTAAISGNKVVLDGGGAVELPSDVLDPGLTGVTIEAWFQDDSTGNNWSRLFDFGETSGNDGGNAMFCVPRQYRSTRFTVATNGPPTWSTGEDTVSGPIHPGEETHVACVWDDSIKEIRIYINGELAQRGTTTMNLSAVTRQNAFIGDSSYPGDPYFTGSVDEFRIYDTALTDEDVMASFDAGPNQTVEFGIVASKANPANNIDEVSIDVGEISWTPGKYANTHNVFFGTDPNYVEDATLVDAESLGVSVYSDLALDSNSIALDRLEYGKTYYWRVDEVNVPANPGTYKGTVWNFTTELLAYPLGSDHISATASPSASEQDPNVTYLGTGLDDSNDMHSNDPATMYLCDGSPAWIQYEFDKIYDIYDLLIWNYNDEGFGADMGTKDVNIAYSEDGETWTDLSGSFVLEKAPGDNTCGPNPPILFGGIAAKYVKLMLNTNFVGWIDSYGISEVRFEIFPKRADEPSPSDEDTNVDYDTTLSWKSGRGAAEHHVYLGTDEAAVEAGTADVQSVNEASYTPLPLTLNTTYYWRVDEVNEADVPSVWDGDVWSFSTQKTILVEGFEDYNDTQPDTVFDTWKDGISDTANGSSRMGNEYEPFCEQDIVRSGDQSAPLYYDNTASAISQAVADTSALAAGSDWTIGDADTLAIWFRGDANNPATDQIYAKLNSTKFVYDGPVSDIARTAWTKWEILLDSVNAANISSITIGVERIGAAGSAGHIYLDDIELIIRVEAAEPAPGNLVAHYEMENNLLDSSGNALNGDPNGAVSYAAGKSGMALVLDGNDTFVNLPIGNLISTLTDCTISTWINWTPGTATGQWSRVFDFGTGTATNFFLTPYANNNQIRAAIKLNDAIGEQQADGNIGILEANNWHHLAVVIETGDPNTMKLYLNGDLIGTRNNLTTLPKDLGVTTQNYLGKSQWPDPDFDGMIDDFRIYDRAFTAGEVKYLAEN